MTATTSPKRAPEIVVKARDLRDRVERRIVTWETEGKLHRKWRKDKMLSEAMCELLGYVGVGHNFFAIFTEDDVTPELMDKLNALLGPNGWAVFKVLLIKQRTQK